MNFGHTRRVLNRSKTRIANFNITCLRGNVLGRRLQTSLVSAKGTLLTKAGPRSAFGPERTKGGRGLQATRKGGGSGRFFVFISKTGRPILWSRLRNKLRECLICPFKKSQLADNPGTAKSPPHFRRGCRGCRTAQAVNISAKSRRWCVNILHPDRAAS
jgi:hypothetical protein